MTTASDPKLGSGAVECGRPVVVIDINEDKLRRPIEKFATVESGIPLRNCVYFTRVGTRFGHLCTWLIARSRDCDKTMLRSFRLCILRLHAEQESLDLILRHLNRGTLEVDNDPETADRINAYFNNATRSILRKTWSGIDKSAISNAYEAASSVQYSTDRSVLVSQFNGARKEVLRKILDYQAKRAAIREVSIVNVLEGGKYMENKSTITLNGNFLGPVIGQQNADFISNDFQNFANSKPSSELLSAVKNLHDDVHKLMKKLAEDPEVGQEVVQEKNRVIALHLKTITEQAAAKASGNSTVPDYLSVSGKGLIDAAKAVADMAQPIAHAVGVVLRLLGG
ncbi:MAG TPA: hypothetical protein VF777_13275 [Phycisphaerales bacterium]